MGKGMETTTLPSHSCVPNSCVQYLTGERLVPGRWHKAKHWLPTGPTITPVPTAGTTTSPVARKRRARASGVSAYGFGQKKMA
jgi:hypothetical protein